MLVRNLQHEHRKSHAVGCPPSSIVQALHFAAQLDCVQGTHACSTVGCKYLILCLAGCND